MIRAAVTGYASIDYPVIVDGYFKGNHTVIIRERAGDAFPRAGGSHLYVGRCLALAGINTSLITWIGDDDPGEFFRSCAVNDGIDTDGIAVVKPGLTPICLLIYQEDGSCGCCFDPGFMGTEALTPQQVDLIRAADLLCITVGPPDIGKQALKLAHDDALIAWVAKNDPISYPEELRILLGQNADYIFCNTHEREWVNTALSFREKPEPLIVETNGAKNVRVEQGGQLDELKVKLLEFSDASGAGDTLAGGSLAAAMNGETDMKLIAEAGMDAAYALLQQRAR